MRWWLVCIAIIRAGAQAPSPSLLDKVKTQVEENLTRLPNYTCTETIRRSQRLGSKAPLQKMDAVRLEVAYVEGKEFFGRPGASQIDEPEIGRLVPGSIGNGQFATIVKSIFIGQAATFGDSGMDKAQGRQALRFGYTVAPINSAFHVATAVGGAIVGYSGSFWVARDTLDLIRLSASADDLPYDLKLASDVTTIDYGQVSIGGAFFVLPLRSNWEAKDIFGAQTRNVVTFENCHQFVGESVLKF
jgi:hypothetical protein